MTDKGEEHVADLPAGFANSGDPKVLSYTQRMVTHQGKVFRQNPNATFKEFEESCSEFRKQLQGNQEVKVDTVLSDAACRELEEETGLEVKNTGSVFNTINFNNGSHIVVHVLYTIERDELPKLTPEKDEGISKSRWIPLKNFKIEHNAEGAITCNVVIDQQSYQIKPYDRIADHIAWVLYESNYLSEKPLLPKSYVRECYEPKQFGI